MDRETDEHDERHGGQKPRMCFWLVFSGNLSMYQWIIDSQYIIYSFIKLKGLPLLKCQVKMSHLMTLRPLQHYSRSDTVIVKCHWLKLLNWSLKSEAWRQREVKTWQVSVSRCRQWSVAEHACRGRIPKRFIGISNCWIGKTPPPSTGCPLNLSQTLLASRLKITSRRSIRYRDHHLISTAFRSLPQRD